MLRCVLITRPGLDMHFNYLQLPGCNSFVMATASHLSCLGYYVGVWGLGTEAFQV